MRKNKLVSFVAILAMLGASLPAGATCGGGGGGGRGGMSPNGATAEQVYQVPWKLVQPSDPAPARGLVLYWFPASANELQQSSLRTSRDLSLYAAQCVTMAIADAGSPLGSRFEVAGKAPAAVLAEASGPVIGRAEGEKGFLRAPAVEKLVRDEMKKREDTVNTRLTDGKTKAKAGDNPGAIDAYKAVWDQRCFFPKKAKDAAKELKRLGAGVAEEGNDSASFEPVFEGARAAEVLKTMKAGLAAELAGHYAQAADLYARAERLDPADPTPPRYLGELYRHHTGQWAKARIVFEALLARPIDPFTRAVALHGLGKMTIHEGKFDKGRELMEESVRAYPLPLAYRNLAVYWNSEGDASKTAAYVKQALDLDPEDAYNRIFAAVFFAASGRTDEALLVAKSNEALLPASYNLAAIYAQAGQREKALTLLKRHFYTYERFDAVRGEEMMEARVDAVFVSLRQDPEFLKLTALADGKLAMPMTAH